MLPPLNARVKMPRAERLFCADFTMVSQRVVESCGLPWCTNTIVMVKGREEALMDRVERNVET